MEPEVALLICKTRLDKLLCFCLAGTVTTMASWRLAFYLASRSRIAHLAPGSTRIRNWAKSLVAGRYFKRPYLSGQVWVNPVNSMDREIFAGRLYDPGLTHLIQACVRDGLSYVDVGANIGLYALAAALERDTAEQYFIAFEPEPMCFSLLQRNCMLNKITWIECRAEGIGAQCGVLPLNVSSTTNTGLNSFIVHDRSAPGPLVPVTTLDDVFFRRVQYTRPVLIKIDTEGYETRVLQGAQQWLSALSNAVVICEMNSYLLDLAASSIAEVHSLLENQAFTLAHKLENIDKTENWVYGKGQCLEFLKNYVANSPTSAHHLR
jgi:FkbM family methyltransferase